MLTNTTNVDRYLINGTPLSTYAIHFPYWDKEEINVYLTNSDGSLSTLTEGTNYTLSTPNGTNGTLTRVGDWTAGATNLTIIREMSLTQEVDLRNGDKIDAETLETALDNLTAQVQQLAETQSRAVVSSVDEAGSNLAIPNKASRIGSGSGTMMGFGSDGESIVLRDLAQFDADVASAASDASSASTSAGTATTQALKSEGYAVGEQNGTPVTSGSPYYENNSKHYAQVAKAGADVITDNLTAITNLDTNMTDINAVADDISNVVAVAGDLTKVDAVADDLTNIDAVNANKTNIDTVAGIASDVTDVAGVASDIPTVAGVSTDISAVATDISDVSAVAGDLVKVKAVADDLTNIDAVNANKTNIDTVAGKASEITTVAGIASNVTTVAGIASNVTTVAGKASEVTTVAGIASDVSAVAQVASDVASVADELTDIGTVASNISDVAAVGADIAKVSAVADDLTSIDAVYADLANIDAADDHALEAEGWAAGTQNGVPVTSGSPYYENNAKYYGQEIPNLKSAIQANSNRISNLEENLDPTGAYKTVNYRGTNAVPTGKAKYGLVESIVGKSRPWNQLIDPSKTPSTESGGIITNNGNGTWSITGTNASTSYVVYSAIPIKQGKTYLFAYKLSSSVTVGTDGVLCGFSVSGVNTYYDTPSGKVFTANADGSFVIRVAGGYNASGLVITPILRDLTLIFPEGVPSTVAEAVSICPDILTYDACRTSIVDTTVEGVLSNMNFADTSDFTNSTINSDGGISSNEYGAVSDFIKVSPSRSLVFTTLASVAVIRFAEYGASKNFIIRNTIENGTKIVAKLNASTEYVRWQINKGSGVSMTKAVLDALEPVLQYGTDRHDYTDTLTLPSPVTLRSAGSVADELDVESGVVTRKVGSVDLSTLSWGESGGVYYTSIADMAYDAEGVCSKYIVTHKNAPDLADGEMNCGYNAGYLQIRTSSSPTGILAYELATPDDPTQLDPVIDNTIQTEGGGTINTIQNNVYPDESPAPTIDNSMDVGYLAL